MNMEELGELLENITIQGLLILINKNIRTFVTYK